MAQKKSIVRARKKVGADFKPGLTQPNNKGDISISKVARSVSSRGIPSIQDLSPIWLNTYEAENIPNTPDDNGIRHLIGEMATLQGRAGWKASERGYAVYGPYHPNLPKGRKYRVRFHLAVGRRRSAGQVSRAYIRVAVLDINDFNPMDPKNHGEVLRRRDVYLQEFQSAENWQTFDLDFDGLQRVFEARVFTEGYVEIYIDKIELFELPSGGKIERSLRIANDIVNHEAESPEMLHEFGRLQRIGATTCWNANVLQDNTPPFGSSNKVGKRMVHGPGDPLPKGTYRASFYLSIDDNQSDAAEVLVLRIIDITRSEPPTYNKGEVSQGILAQRGILRTDFHRPQIFQPFELDFSVLDSKARIDYEVIWQGVAEINLDRIEISLLTDQFQNDPEPELTVLGGKIFYGNYPIQLLGVSSYGWLATNSGEDYKHFLDTLEAHHINFTRVFAIFPWTHDLYPFSRRTDKKFNLPELGIDESENNYDALYFQRLRDFLDYAGQKGIIVQIVLFDETGMNGLDDPRTWDRHPYNSRNNTKGRINDPNKGIPTFYEDPGMRDLIEPYIRYLVRATRDYGNIIYEVANQYSGPIEWHQWVTEKIKEQIQEDRRTDGVYAGRGKHRLVSANVQSHLLHQIYHDKNVDILCLHSEVWLGSILENNGMSAIKGIPTALQLFPGKPVILSTAGLQEESDLIERPLQDRESPSPRSHSLADKIYTWANKIIQKGGHFEFLDYKIQIPAKGPFIRPSSWNIDLPVLQRLSEINLPTEVPFPPQLAAVIPPVSRFSALRPILEDPLTNKTTKGRHQGGEFTSEGFKVTGALNNFLLYQPDFSGTEYPPRQILVEFEAKGFMPNEETDSKLVFFRMFDAPPDEQEGSLQMIANHSLYEIRKYGLEGGQIRKATNGLGLKLGGRGIRNFTELGTWRPRQARTGNLSWDPDKKYLFQIIWNQSRTKIYRDEVLIYDVYEPRFAPTKIYIRLGGTSGDRKAPVGVTYSNVRIYGE